MNLFNARSILRSYIRKLEKKGSYSTAKGKVNRYIGRTNQSLRIQTDNSKKPMFLKFKVIRAALTLTSYLRTITRKDLEIYTKGANSALLGIIIEAFGPNGGIAITGNGLIRFSLRGTRYFFAGADRSVRDLEIAAENGAKYVLMSYVHIKDRKAWRTHVERLGLKVLLDSGAFTAWQATQRGKSVYISLEEYAAFIFTHMDVLYGYFNLDVIGDPQGSSLNAERLKGMGLNPIEVWHVGGDLHELQRLVQLNKPILALGGSVGMSEKKRARVFRWIFKLFPGQNFHFLGGSSRLLQKYPWFSADSTSWIVGRKYRAIIDEVGQHKAPEGMLPLKALAYNVRYLVSLESGKC